MKTLLIQCFFHTKIEVLSTARQMCLKEHSLNLTESKTHTSKLQFEQECSDEDWLVPILPLQSTASALLGDNREL